MILIINAAQLNRTTIGLAKNHFFAKKIFRSQYKEAEKLLPEVEKLLDRNGIKIRDLKGIIAVVGSAKSDGFKVSGFTALRIGVAAANSLGFALNIPVVGVKLEEFKDFEDLVKLGRSRLKENKKRNILEPAYNRNPNINCKKLAKCLV